VFGRVGFFRFMAETKSQMKAKGACDPMNHDIHSQFWIFAHIEKWHGRQVFRNSHVRPYAKEVDCGRDDNACSD
jgi:hypothetical protein